MRTNAGRSDGRRRRRRSAKQQQALIEAYQAGGLSKAAFCRRRGIQPASFYRWLRRYPKNTPAFAEVQVALAAPNLRPLSAAAPVEVELRSGLRLHIRDLGRLAEVAAFIREIAAC
jgi:transposase-like protein